ncbi:MAG TPA: molybdopterin cofactor-binding domain-containing protein, partial [Rubrivivax sp.]|nr:molybdopterin cofactor-binding domain-containing protein [Rubrivivax sp.]
VPGMLHGRVIRPPYAGADHGDFIGNTLLAVDETSVAHIRSLRGVVVIRDFVGVVAEREEDAEAAMHALSVTWKPWPGLPPVADIEQALRNNPATARQLVDEGDVDSTSPAIRLDRTYLWPYQLHASIGPSCAVADWRGDHLQVWAGTQNPHVLRADLARLTGLPDTAVDVVRMEAAGCYGRNGADDVAADAALLSRAVGAPVRVQLTREQENAWDPKGAAQWMQVSGGIDAQGAIQSWDFQTSYPSNGAPTLALLLTRTIEPAAQAYEMGDRSARPPYAAANLRVTVNDMAPVLRASWLRGVSALPNSFAHESYVDELAHAAGADPVAYRLRHLNDSRAAELVAATAQRAGWKAHSAPQQQAPTGDWLHGQGFAYARYVHSKWPGFGAAWAAWVADVDVNRLTGEVNVTRVVVGHDAGLMVNPAGVKHQVHGNVLQTTSRALKERVEVDPQTRSVANREWGSYPILNFREVPVIDVLTMPRPGDPPLGAGESASVPGTAAIANAIFDATGVRFREPPFTPEKVRAALNPLPPAQPPRDQQPAAGPAEVVSKPTPAMLPGGAPWPQRRGLWAAAGAVGAGVLSFAASLFGAREAIAPIAAPDVSMYTAGTLERGRVLAAAGNCIDCHTAAGGAPNSGGRPMQT